MGPLPHLIARGREPGPPGGVDGLLPVHVRRLVPARVAYPSHVPAALAALLAVVQAMAPAGPSAGPRGTGPPGTVRGPPRLLARALGARPRVSVGYRARVAGGFSRAAWRPALHLGGPQGGDRRGVPGRSPCERAWGGGGRLGRLGAAWPPAPARGTARRRGGPPVPWPPAWPGGAGAACACTGPPVAAGPLGAGRRCHVGCAWARRVQRGRRVEALSPAREPPRRRPRLESRGGGQGGGGPRPLPHAAPQPPGAGPPRACRAARPRPGRAPGTLRAHGRGAGPPSDALPSGGAPCAWRARLAAPAWTRDASGPAHGAHVLSSLLGIVQGREQGFPLVAPTRGEPPHATDTACRC
jgi:hypothetical protein